MAASSAIIAEINTLGSLYKHAHELLQQFIAEHGVPAGAPTAVPFTPEQLEKRKLALTFAAELYEPLEKKREALWSAHFGGMKSDRLSTPEGEAKEKAYMAMTDKRWALFSAMCTMRMVDKAEARTNADCK